MTHELKQIVEAALLNQASNIKNVLATVVDLDGSSYRRPGVRMLLSSNGNMVGAVSGGCVENEVLRRAQSVFKTGQSKIMTYDGRYRLGCEGVLYILLEPFEVSNEFKKVFFQALENRNEFTIASYYKKEDECVGDFYSTVSFGKNDLFPFSKNHDTVTPQNKNVKIFSQSLPPCFKLLIIGGEHDAVKLCKMASLLGWEVDVVTSIKDPKQIQDFLGAKTVTANTPEAFTVSSLDKECAVVLMTHNYAQDLRYLIKLKDCKLPYIGVLGSAKRREQLQNDLFDYTTDFEDAYLESIHSPAGLNLGAITPEEIALSILSEILSIIRNKQPINLNTISGKIHSQN
ncbi:Xanthine and CO dehydrogenase maturation factor, XdhC/CoxF family [Flaviramulus basaltis]|uniref:Xanthine and CO dehydrogenase maturation factor, XdhC/CoxF family n=1 Tax=Flaviramulus basaltis TaxID=369401 RepID=A0A1K2IKH3_9FLAO|nr:XdhC/CoxI family protein [Flaviramulus basaltis]SFZ92770.1 Xanthine and CO dehydrogenase maturation factor, XdhC/CoxF family [Flaviramulus basaltis]